MNMKWSPSGRTKIDFNPESLYSREQNHSWEWPAMKQTQIHTLYELNHHRLPEEHPCCVSTGCSEDGLSTLKMKSAIRGPGVLKVCLSAPFWNSIVVFSTTKTPGVLKLCSPLFPWRVFDSITEKLKIEFKYESYPTDIWFQMTFLLCMTSVCVTNKCKTIYLVDGIDSYGQNGLANFGGASKGVLFCFVSNRSTQVLGTISTTE